jgi:hypothetical protein
MQSDLKTSHLDFSETSARNQCRKDTKDSLSLYVERQPEKTGARNKCRLLKVLEDFEGTVSRKIKWRV